MPIITKTNGLIGYDNQASQLQVRVKNRQGDDGSNYERIYPQQLGRSVIFNENTLRTNGRHIQLKGDNVGEVVDEIEKRISQGGRTFEVVNGIAETRIFRTVVYYNEIYYALFSNNNSSTIYSSNDAQFWTQIKIINDESYHDMTTFNNGIYMVGVKFSDKSMIIKEYTTNNIIKIDTQYQYLIDNCYISSDNCSICAVASSETNTCAFYGTYNNNDISWTQYLEASKITGNNLINIGNGAYVTLCGDYIKWYSFNRAFSSTNIIAQSISNYDSVNNCFYLCNGKNLYKVILFDSFGFTISKVYTFPNDIGKYYDLIYVNGKYIYNTYNIEADVPCCAYAIKPYDNVLYTDGKYIINQPLVNLCYEGHYLFAKGYNDNKMYCSLVK